MQKGDKRPPKTDRPVLTAVATRQGSQARAMERSLNQTLLAHLEEAYRTIEAQEGTIRRFEAGEWRYTCHGCLTTVWGERDVPPNGWQITETGDQVAHYCHQCARPRRDEFSPRAAATAR